MSLKVLIENYKKFKTNSQGAIELLYDIKAFGQNLSDDSEFTPTEINEILLILSLLLKEPNLNKNEILFTLSRLIYNTNYNCYIDFYPIFSAILYFIINYCVDEEDLIFDKALILIDYLLFQITSVQDFGIIDDTASQELTKICIDIISDNEHIQNINTSLSIIVSLCRIRPNFLKFIHTWSLIRTKKFCQQLLRLLEHTERTVMLNTLVIYLNIASRIDSEINKSFLTETNMNQILEILFVSLNEVTSKFRQINMLPHNTTRPKSCLNGPHHTDFNDNTIIHDLNFLLLIMADVLSNAKINAYIEQQTQAWPRFKSCANELFTMIFANIKPLKGEISYIAENSINLGLTLSLHGVCCVQNIILQSTGTGETNYKTVEKKPDHPGIDDVDDEIDLTNLSCMSLDEIRSNTNKDHRKQGDNNHISPHSVGEFQCILESEQMVSTPYPKLEHYFATTPNHNGLSNGKNNEEPLQPQKILNSIHQFRCLMTWIFTGQGTPFLQLIRNNFCHAVAEENSLEKLSSQTPPEDYAKRIWNSLLLNCCADLPSSEFGDSANPSIPKIRTLMYQTLKNEAFLFSNQSNFQNDTNAVNVNCCPQRYHPENGNDLACETLKDDAPIILKPITIYTLNILKQIFYGNNSNNNNNSKAIADCVEIFYASCHYLECLIQNVFNLLTHENPNEMEYKIIEMIMNRVLFICTIAKEFNHWILVQNACLDNVNSILASIIESFTKLFHHLGVWCCSHVNNSNNVLFNEISFVSLYLAKTICQMTLPHRNRENMDAKIMSQQFSQVIPAMLCGLDCSSKVNGNNNTSINDNKNACLEWLNHCIVWFMRQINLSSSKSQANSAKQLLNTALFCYFNRILLDINPSPNNSQQTLDTLVSRYKRLLQSITKCTFEDTTPKNTNLIEYNNGQSLNTYHKNCVSTIKNGYYNFSGDSLCEPNSYKDLVLDIEDILIKLRASLNSQNAKRENNIVNGVNSNRYQILSQNQTSNNAEFLDNPVFPIASIIELYEKAKLYFTMRLEMQNVMVKRQTDLLATYQTQLQLSQQTTQLNQNQNLTYRQTISQLQSLCERKSEMLQCHKQQQNQNEMEKQRLNDHIKMQQNALEEMQETVNIESTKRDAVQKNMDTLRTEYESLNEMHQVVLRHFDASKKQLEILRENLANSENNNLTLTKESKEKDLKIKELNAQLDEGRKQYETARKDNAKLNSNIEGLRKEIQALEETKKLLQTQKNELEMLSKRQESQIQQKDEEVSKLRNDLLIYSEITAKINMLTTEIKPKR